MCQEAGPLKSIKCSLCTDVLSRCNCTAKVPSNTADSISSLGPLHQVHRLLGGCDCRHRLHQHTHGAFIDAMVAALVRTQPSITTPQGCIFAPSVLSTCKCAAAILSLLSESFASFAMGPGKQIGQAKAPLVDIHVRGDLWILGRGRFGIRWRRQGAASYATTRGQSSPSGPISQFL